MPEHNRQDGSTKPVCVILDTNIWLNTSLLRIGLGAALTFALMRINGVVGLPEVLEQEVIKNTVKRGVEAVIEIRKKFDVIGTLVGSRDDYRVPEETEFEASAKNRLADLDELLVRVPFTLEHARSALNRVMEEAPPNGSKNQQFKDSAIWEATLDLANSYEVHFITSDKGFFQDREPSKGLAYNLRDEIAPATPDKHVFVYHELSACLTTLRKDAPLLDYAAIAIKIDRALNAKVKLRDVTARRGFEILGLTNSNISAFLTENRNTLSLSYELVYQAAEIIGPGDEVPLEVKLLAKGTCSLILPDESIAELRNESVEIVGPNDHVIQRDATAFLSSSIVFGRRSIPFTLREPLED